MQGLLEEIFTKLKTGLVKRNHPFKYGNLASVHQGFPEQRTVVLRKMQGNNITIYTDSRSAKVHQFKVNSKASIRVYNPKSMEQIILKGEIQVSTEDNQHIWKQLPENALRDYTSELPPGTAIETQYAEFNPHSPHFCLLHFAFTAIDYLKIERPLNYRARFELANGSWNGNYVVP